MPQTAHATAFDVTDLAFIAGNNPDSSANAIAITGCASRFDAEPVIAVALIVHQQFISRIEEQIEKSIIIIIDKNRIAVFESFHTGASFFANLDKFTVCAGAVISIQFLIACA